MGGDACVIGSWPSAGAAAPRVKPPANVAPLFRSSRRLKRFERIGLSFADEPKRKTLTRSRKYTPVSGCTDRGVSPARHDGEAALYLAAVVKPIAAAAILGVTLLAGVALLAQPRPPGPDGLIYLLTDEDAGR
jgi:hypothetical protein